MISLRDALPRRRTATFAEHWLALRNVARTLLPTASVAAPARPHYSGSFGDTGSGLTPYDQMTTEQHDAAGALWAVWMGDE